MQFHLNGFKAGDPKVHPINCDNSGKGNHIPAKVDVMIAGCGPAGLCLAAQLSQHPEITTVVVEPKSGPMEKGQADGISVRSMEMFQTFGFAERIKEESVWINETTFWTPDQKTPTKISRAGRVQDVEDGLSEMPHVIINQARIHDMYLEIMEKSPTRLEPSYNHKIIHVDIDNADDQYPVSILLEQTNQENPKQFTVRARYLVGCDGARSTVRKSIGAKLDGDAAHQAWGVIDVLLNTDFPDIRMKSIIQSAHDGSILIIPREGGYLVRFYVELDKLSETERVSERGLTEKDIIDRANKILSPYSIDVKEIVWWSIYEIGHRITNSFDNTGVSEGLSRDPCVFIAGDACHTHSPKAGQGMNVSMGDTFNLGWKLISVLLGYSDKTLLHTYSEERQKTAQALIDFDHEWSRAVSKKSDPALSEMPTVQRKFLEGGKFTAGLTVKYQPSTLTQNDEFQNLAKGFPIGERFHSAMVDRLADAKPMQLGHTQNFGYRWTLFIFAPQDKELRSTQLRSTLDSLEQEDRSPIRKSSIIGLDPDQLLDLRIIYPENFRELEYSDMHSVLKPRKGKYGLVDYEKVFCAQKGINSNIFDLREVNRTKGAMVLVRPDQYVSTVLPIDATTELFGILEDVWPNLNV
ncbi:MAG: FAD-dependent monooxygenase [Paracoccaceae bacterium]